MKKQLRLAEFAFVMLFLVLPPVFYSSTAVTKRTLSYPVTVFLLSGIAFFIFEIHKKNEQKIIKNSTERLLFALINCGNVLMTFGLLSLSAGLLELLSSLFILQSVQIAIPLMPHSVTGCVNVIAGTLCAVFYEEVIYRLYLPAALNLFLKNKYNIVSEVLPVIFFALGHRYLGIYGILNATAGGIFLRYSLIKSKTMITNFSAHAGYNFFMIALSFCK
jgi:membrane protease YdiL (CAAX protease family)